MNLNYIFLIMILLIFLLFISGCVKSPTNSQDNNLDINNEKIDLPLIEQQTEANIILEEIIAPKDVIVLVPKLQSWKKEDGIRISGISSSTIFQDNQYWMYYTGNGIELAKSGDGLDFYYVKNIISAKDISDVDMVSNPSVFKTKDNKYRMIFEGSKMHPNKQTRKLYSAISSDGMIWIIEEGVRFQDIGDGKPGELFTSVPEIIRLDDGRLRMYYTRGITSATALSDDDGLIWVKETNLDLGKIAIDLDIVKLDNNSYKLFFTTFADEFGVGEQWITSASSNDGINFVLDKTKLVEPSTHGGLVTDPDVIKVGNGYRMYYGEFKKGQNEVYDGESNILSAFCID